MAGLAQNAQRSASRRARHAISLFAAVALLAALLLAGRAAAPSPAAAELACPPLPVGLSPPGPSATRFTMMIRINTQGNVNTWTQFNESNGGLGDRVRPQDIFVLNTRF